MTKACLETAEKFCQQEFKCHGVCEALQKSNSTTCEFGYRCVDCPAWDVCLDDSTKLGCPEPQIKKQKREHYTMCDPWISPVPCNINDLIKQLFLVCYVGPLFLLICGIGDATY